MQKDRHPYAALRRDHCAFHVPAAETVDHTAVRRADRVRGHAAKKITPTFVSADFPKTKWHGLLCRILSILYIL